MHLRWVYLPPARIKAHLTLALFLKAVLRPMLTVQRLCKVQLSVKPVRQGAWIQIMQDAVQPIKMFAVFVLNQLNHTWLPSGQANRSKDVFMKYVDSVLSKCAKIRSLIGDLQKNYPNDGTAKLLLISIGIRLRADSGVSFSLPTPFYCKLEIAPEICLTNQGSGDAEQRPANLGRRVQQAVRSRGAGGEG